MAISNASNLNALLSTGLNTCWSTSRAQLMEAFNLVKDTLANHQHDGVDIISGTINTARIPWGTPGAIGATTPASGAFTSLEASAGLNVAGAAALAGSLAVTGALAQSTDSANNTTTLASHGADLTNNLIFRRSLGSAAAPTQYINHDDNYPYAEIKAQTYNGTTWVDAPASIRFNTAAKAFAVRLNSTDQVKLSSQSFGVQYEAPGYTYYADSGFMEGPFVQIGMPSANPSRGVEMHPGTGGNVWVRGGIASALRTEGEVYVGDDLRVTGNIGFRGANAVGGPIYGAPTGTATRTAFETTTVTTAQLAQRVKAIIDDLRSQGIFL